MIKFARIIPLLILLSACVNKSKIQAQNHINEKGKNTKEFIAKLPKSLQAILAEELSGYTFNKDSLDAYIQEDTSSISDFAKLNENLSNEELLDSLAKFEEKMEYKFGDFPLIECKLLKLALKRNIPTAIASLGYRHSFQYNLSNAYGQGKDTTPHISSNCACKECNEYKGYLYIWYAIALGSMESLFTLSDYYGRLGNGAATEKIYVYAAEEKNQEWAHFGLFKLYYYGEGIYADSRNQMKKNNQKIDKKKGLYHLEKGIQLKDPLTLYYKALLESDKDKAFEWLIKSYERFWEILPAEYKYEFRMNVNVVNVVEMLSNKHSEKWKKYKYKNNISDDYFPKKR